MLNKYSHRLTHFLVFLKLNELKMKANVLNMYSQTVPKDGPIPTSFAFGSNSNYLKKGNTKEEEGHTVDDPVFGMKIKYFGHKAVFKQRIKLKSKADFNVNATVEFMTCNNTQCLPPKEVDLIFEIK